MENIYFLTHKIVISETGNVRENEIRNWQRHQSVMHQLLIVEGTKGGDNSLV